MKFRIWNMEVGRWNKELSKKYLPYSFFLIPYSRL